MALARSHSLDPPLPLQRCFSFKFTSGPPCIAYMCRFPLPRQIPNNDVSGNARTNR